MLAYLIYRAIAYNEPWWQDVLADNLGITNLLIPVQAKQRDKGIAYLPGIEGKIKKSLASGDRYKKTIGGKDYELYSLARPRTQNYSVMLDGQWQNTLEVLNKRRLAGYTTFLPVQMKEYARSSGAKKLMTDNIERSFYDFYQFSHSRATSVPRPAALPFSSQYIDSTNFTNNALSLSTLYSKDDGYNYLHEKLPSLANLQRPSFIGLTKGTVGLPVTLNVPQNGSYRILLHAASKKNQVQATMGGQQITLRKIQGDLGNQGDYIDFTYYYADVTLNSGSGKLVLQNTDANAVAVDSVNLMPKNDLPQDFSHVSLPNLAIAPTNKPLIYDIRVEEDHAR